MMLVKWILVFTNAMRFDIHRLRANSTLSDPDAFKYAREAAVTTNPKLIHNRFYQSNKRSFSRPVPVALGLLVTGVAACYALTVNFKPPEKSIVVQQTVDRLKRDLEAYEAHLKSTSCSRVVLLKKDTFY